MALNENPGCYGLPSAVSATCRSCVECPVRSGCLVDAGALLERLPDNPLTKRERLSFALTNKALTSVPRRAGDTNPQLTVAASSRGLKRVTLAQSEEQMIQTLPDRVAKQVRQLMERGWFDFARSELRAGRNPATKGWKKVLCECLLKGNVSRPGLVLALTEQLNLTPASAKVQASVGISIFAAGRLATEQFGQLVPNLN